MRSSMATVGIALALFLVTACNKGDSIEKLRADGYGCHLASAGAAFVSKPGEHCFVCQDQDSMLKCSKNPIGSGCKEDANACKKPEK